MEKKSRKRSGKRTKNHVIVTEEQGNFTWEGAIIYALTEAQKKKMKQSIRKSGVASFKVEEIQVKTIPSVRVTATPVHQG